MRCGSSMTRRSNAVSRYQSSVKRRSSRRKRQKKQVVPAKELRAGQLRRAVHIHRKERAPRILTTRQARVRIRTPPIRRTPVRRRLQAREAIPEEAPIREVRRTHRLVPVVPARHRQAPRPIRLRAQQARQARRGGQNRNIMGASCGRSPRIAPARALPPGRQDGFDFP